MKKENFHFFLLCGLVFYCITSIASIEHSLEHINDSHDHHQENECSFCIFSVIHEVPSVDNFQLVDNRTCIETFYLKFKQNTIITLFPINSSRPRGPPTLS
jgi:hypothetical protein